MAFAERLLDLSPGKVSVAFGTLFVDTPLKPNVMIDLENDVILLSHVISLLFSPLYQAEASLESMSLLRSELHTTLKTKQGESS